MTLTIKGEFRVKLDKSDLELVSKYHWHIADCSKHNARKLYARYVGPRPNRRYIYMHRLIMGEPPGLVIDHINGDGLDNRRSNLRVTSVAENARHQYHRKRGLEGGHA